MFGFLKKKEPQATKKKPHDFSSGNIITRLLYGDAGYGKGRWAYNELREASMPDRDYFVLMSISVIIAVAGLFLNSVAVIIGAMLIAPLMSPLLAAGLAIAHGDAKFLRLAVSSILKGVLASLLVAVGLTLIIPHPQFGNEILSRIQPNLLDLTVALASGVAGAYTYSSKELSAALPGVAIAAALIPPLGVVGIGIGSGRIDIFLGSSLLFIANMVAIAFGAAITFILLGFYPKKRKRDEGPRKRGLIFTAALLVLVVVPMAYFTFYSITSFTQSKATTKLVGKYLPSRDGFEIGSVELISMTDYHLVRVLVYGEEPPIQDRIDFIQDELEMKLGKPVELNIQFIPFQNLSAD